MIIVDTTEHNLAQERLGLTDLILCEVLQRTTNPTDFRSLQRKLLRFEIFATGGVPFAIAAARNYQRLRSEGVTVRRTIDCLIATFCLQGGHSLLHSDRDFDPFERLLGMAVVHP